MTKRANKVGGSYQAAGTIVSTFNTLAGEERHVFEFDVPKGMLHIFGPSQVEIEEIKPDDVLILQPTEPGAWPDALFRAPAAPLNPSQEVLHSKIGQALSDALFRAPGEVDPDWCDSREIDRLVDVVMAVLPIITDDAIAQRQKDILEAAMMYATCREQEMEWQINNRFVDAGTQRKWDSVAALKALQQVVDQAFAP